jgi:hypothetical protein
MADRVGIRLLKLDPLALLLALAGEAILIVG